MYNLSDFGSYTVAGRAVSIADREKTEVWFTPSTSFTIDPNGTYPIEQAYVQYFVPADRNRLPPIVLLHGGGMTGTTWETTPDGRPGWLQLLVQRGYEVHVVDGVERGRAGWCALDGVWDGDPIQRPLEEAWTLFRFGARDDFVRRRPFQGQRFPVDALEALGRSFVPRWTSTTSAAIDAFGSVLARVGPAIVICHSQGGEVALAAGARRADLVRAMVAIEPSGFGNDLAAWRERDVLAVYGDYHDVGDGVPDLLGKGRQWLGELRAAGGDGDLIHLPEQGISGNSHMIMMDDNNAQVLDIVVRWIEEKLLSDRTAEGVGQRKAFIRSAQSLIASSWPGVI